MGSVARATVRKRVNHQQVSCSYYCVLLIILNALDSCYKSEAITQYHFNWSGRERSQRYLLVQVYSLVTYLTHLGKEDLFADRI